MEVFRDNSPWAFTHNIGFAANVMSLNVLIFWLFCLFVFFLGDLGDKKKVPKMIEEGDEVPEAQPAIAGGSK